MERGRETCEKGFPLGPLGPQLGTAAWPGPQGGGGAQGEAGLRRGGAWSRGSGPGVGQGAEAGVHWGSEEGGAWSPVKLNKGWGLGRGTRSRERSPEPGLGREWSLE